MYLYPNVNNQKSYDDSKLLLKKYSMNAIENYFLCVKKGFCLGKTSLFALYTYTFPDDSMKSCIQGIRNNVFVFKCYDRRISASELQSDL